ncbi:hypothetical protein QBC46DRAFT_454652 [Diplogelasinospora grovesii]|uniref:Uncharacterized protein n=1 Tax=Diplogelasinospora grovesii TaxID=303347 RepID=A0AAN6RYB9_9PEZI|nr:hypothetical protein QBC46DRAFT_454652 [Diplogelasinospora grovesii]
MAFHRSTQEFQQWDSNFILASRAHTEQNESQAWAIFSPGNDGRTATSYQSFVHDAQVIPGVLMNRDLLSTHSDFSSEADSSTVLTPVLELEDDAKIDSLGNYLSEFRTASYHYTRQQGVSHMAPVFPVHNGLGSHGS